MTTYPSSTPPRRSGHSGLWAAITFVLLLTACLAGLALVMSGGRLPELGDAASWTPPPEGSSAAAVEAPAPAGGATFAPGDAVRNANAGPVNLRQSAGYQNKPAGDVIAVVPAGQVGEITGGPQEADGLIWWQVRFDGLLGWMAERSSQGVTLLDRP
ncbi:MAG TPA: hypothetical protein PKM78_10540 [Anaerolineae bacterium]|nr:hypothetical protein [Anaerolineae bacterium]